MIEISGLVKKYDKVTAVDGLDLAVAGGEFFGFLGPNGAGKTTTIKVLAGLLKPTAGTARVGGHDILKEPVQAKSIIGYIPDRPFIYEKLTGREYLKFVADLYGMEPRRSRPRAERFLEFFDLAEYGDELVDGYSHGMRQKLIISGALIHEPKAVIVDEPLVGLDPKGARQVKQLFSDLCGKGVCLFMSTHSLGVAEAMCHRVGIIQKGRMIALGTVEELRLQARNARGGLEEIFLELTGDKDMQSLADSLQSPA
ncbi:MAG: ABC transporter ATP-binding protein [Nitrospinae bacterium]|nr:ABC transporter ATP-binding protein [Nitrospinota bacterium]